MAASTTYRHELGRRSFTCTAASSADTSARHTQRQKHKRSLQKTRTVRLFCCGRHFTRQSQLQTAQCSAPQNSSHRFTPCVRFLRNNTPDEVVKLDQKVLIEGD
jgi:hypothetical protein